jgi:hypothetical protein
VKLRNRAGRAASLGVLAFLALGGLAACGGGSSPSSNTSGIPANGSLKPSALGDAQCHAGESTGGSVYAQVAVQGVGCVKAASVASTAGSAKGTAYGIDGFSCKATAEGSGSPWASAWGGTYYDYFCQDGNAQLAFNWGQDYTYDGSGPGSSQSTTTTTASSVPASGALQPAALGEGQCDAGQADGGSTYAQIAISGTTCDVAAMVGPPSGSAAGGSYSINGFSCTATQEGSGSPWASAWGGTYYAYSCKDGAEQVAFNWGSHYVYSG